VLDLLSERRQGLVLARQRAQGGRVLDRVGSAAHARPERVQQLLARAREG
jgi:hypothetical protein